jgi:hypothetical protein
MLDVRLTPRIDFAADGSLRDETGEGRALPPELAILAALSPDWQPWASLAAAGFPDWQIERLFLAGIVDVGRGRFCIPRRARAYFEEQFPERAAERPFATWLTAPLPRVLWLGLPYTNLARLAHSTAVGLAAILATASPATIPVFGVLPDEAPSTRSHEDLEDLVGLAAELDLRLGIIGGDHRATWSMLRTVKSALPGKPVQYIHVDAHHDLYRYRSDRPPDRVNHANFLADLLQRGCVDRAVLIGRRDGAEPLRAALDDGLPIGLSATGEAWQLADWSDDAHTHLSVDLDILDPRWAPAVSSPIEEGWTPDALIRTLANIMGETRIDSCSVVEAGGGDQATTKAALAVIELLGT